MRIRASSTSDEYHHEEVLCGFCGVHEWLKIPIEQYNARSEREIVLETVIEEPAKKSVGREIYGGTARAAIARRVKRNKK